MTIRALKARKAEVAKKARDITSKAKAENRDLTDNEAAEFDAAVADANRLQAQIDREEALANVEAGITGAGASTVEVPDNARMSVSENVAADPRRGFASMGDFAAAVRRSSMQGATPDQRLVISNGVGLQAAAPGTYSNESAGEDGGFMIPPEFSRSLWSLSLEEDAIMSYADDTPVTGNSMVFPQDETTPWGTDGVRAYWAGEAASGTPTKMKIGTASLRLNKLLALCPVTDELMADGVAMGAYLPPLMARSIRWKANEAILTGAGAGLPLGINNTDALVTVAKESGQAAASLVALNLAKMIARLPAGSFSRAVWLINNEVLPQLFTLTLGNQPIWMPTGNGATGIQASPYGLLLGRPIMVTQHAEALGSAGDVQLHDFNYYRTITKAGGIQTDTSMHLYFDAGLTAYRCTFRMDGRPKLKAAIQPAKGSATLSPFVRLGARA